MSSRFFRLRVGKTIVGIGSSPDGFNEGFIATMPKPGTLIMITMSVPWLVRRRR